MYSVIVGTSHHQSLYPNPKDDPVPEGALNQTIEIWFRDYDEWVNIKDGVLQALEEVSGVHNVIDVNYRDEDSAEPYVSPEHGDYCIFVFGKDNHLIAKEVLRVIRGEYQWYRDNFHVIAIKTPSTTVSWITGRFGNEREITRGIRRGSLLVHRALYGQGGWSISHIPSGYTILIGRKGVGLKTVDAAARSLVPLFEKMPCPEKPDFHSSEYKEWIKLVKPCADALRHALEDARY